MSGWGKRIAIGVSVIVIAAILVGFGNLLQNDYGDISYQLSGPTWVYAQPLNKFDLNIQNTGSIKVVPVCTISVVNASIQKVTIPEVAQYQLSQYCSYNETTATITNLTIPISQKELATLFSIEISPTNGCNAFSVSSNVVVPWDILHPRSSVGQVLPTEFRYSATTEGVYQKLSQNPLLNF